jgi:hypothetical protein
MIVTASFFFWPLKAINSDIFVRTAMSVNCYPGLKLMWNHSKIKKRREELTLLSALQGTGQEGFEPPTPWSVATCSSPLSYKPLRSAQLNYHTL